MDAKTFFANRVLGGLAGAVGTAAVRNTERAAGVVGMGGKKAASALWAQNGRRFLYSLGYHSAAGAVVGGGYAYGTGGDVTSGALRGAKYGAALRFGKSGYANRGIATGAARSGYRFARRNW